MTFFIYDKNSGKFISILISVSSKIIPTGIKAIYLFIISQYIKTKVHILHSTASSTAICNDNYSFPFNIQYTKKCGSCQRESIHLLLKVINKVLWIKITPV